MKNLLFVDDEPKVLQGLQRQLRGMRNEWNMYFVDSGPKALEFLSTNSVEVIVSDMVMPGMDGAELLTEVMKRHPGIVRLVLSGHSDREAVLRLVGPAHQYLSKPCNSEELRSAIVRALALRDLLSSEELKDLVSRIKCLPSLPTLYTKLMEELRKDDPSMDRLVDIISKDIGMTTKILQLVNSAFFGLPQPAASVGDAVVYLGMATIRTMVLSMEVFSQFDPRIIQAFSLNALVDHCWMTGLMAKRIAEAEQKDARFADQCFLAGLLHDVGYLILAANMPDMHAQAIRRAREMGRPVWETEKADMGATHAEVGAYLLGLWGLPSLVIEAVALHHRPRESTFKGFSPLVAVHVADVLARKRYGDGICEPGSSFVDREFLSSLGLDGRLEEWSRQCEDCTQVSEHAV